MELILTRVLWQAARAGLLEVAESGPDVDDALASLQAAEVGRRQRCPDPSLHAPVRAARRVSLHAGASGSTRTIARGWSG